MSDRDFSSLLDRLQQGDESAARELCIAYEPHLRMVIRRQISAAARARFDSIDIVQSVWADVLDGFRRRAWDFTEPAQLRAFLVRVARNRLVDRVRHESRSLACEQAAVDDSQMPAEQTARPSQVVQADDLWRQMLALCKPEHRDILTLKRQGLSLDEIAARTGLHASSVRRILYDLARRLTAAESVPAASRV